jgi:predicted kinase
MADYTEQRFDYSGGRADAPELIIMVGVSGSGKSVIAKQWVDRGRGNIARLNRDSIRALLWNNVPWNNNLENLVRNWQMEGARMALQSGKDVIIDDTNCVRQTRQKWEEFATQMRVKFRIVTMTTELDVCIERDSKREGKEKVGEGVIRRQHKDLTEIKVQPSEAKEPVKLTRPYFERTEYLRNGGWVARLPNAQWVLVDTDGTVADCVGIRSPFDETRVLEDKVYEVVAEWVRALYPHYNVCVVSGRHDSCGDDTCDWWEMHGIPFDHILMRYSGDNRSDVIVKQEILNELAAVVGKENIAFVLDDRPRVVEMWRSNGIRVFPVRGTTTHVEGCTFNQPKGYRICSDCGALEYF